MSNLRIIGIVFGLFGLLLAFRIYRGPRWKRFNFVILGIFSISLTAVSLYPDLLNTIAGMLSLHPEQRGRLLTLLVFSIIILWFLVLYFKTKLDKYAYQFDLLIRNLGYEGSSGDLEDGISDKEIMVIIPAYNEVDSIRELLERIPHKIAGKNLGVIVVDDGSTDGTAEEVKRAGHLVVRNKINRGQGGASRLGYDILLRYSNVKVGVTMDADGQHLPEELDKLIVPVLDGQYDLVIGSRVLGQRQRGTFLRNVGISTLTKLINFLTGLSLTDCSSGFKAFNVDKMKKLQLKEEQFQAGETLVEAAKKGLKIGEAPITILERKHGVSKKGKDILYGLGFTKAIFKSWWKSR